jgi:hypothetical protein
MTATLAPQIIAPALASRNLFPTTPVVTTETHALKSIFVMKEGAWVSTP